MAEVTIIVPVYKVEKYLSRCIESILRQTYTDFDLILIDDGSPDNCGRICDEYVVKDSRVHVIHQKNAGLSAARNSGIEWAFLQSKSKWITFVDSDDWIHPEMIRYLYDAVCNFNSPISICSYYKTDNCNFISDFLQIKTQLWDTEQFYLERNVNATVAWGKLYQKESFKNIRYPEGKLHEDEYVTYRILFQYSTVAVVDAPLYVYFQNKDSIMHSSWSPHRLDVLEALEVQIKFFKENNFQAIYYNRIKIYVILAAEQYNYCRLILFSNRIAIYLKLKIMIRFFENQKRHLWDKKTELYILEILFPHLMNCYWLMQTLKSKLKNEGIRATAASVLKHIRKDK